MKMVFFILALLSTETFAEGYYYPLPANPPAYIYALPPAYVVPPPIYYPPPVYIAPPPPAAPGIIRGQPPVFVPFETGRVVPRGGYKKDE